jgi:hypothetical protein
MGIDEKKANALSSGRPNHERRGWTSASITRTRSELASDDLARMVWVDECYIQCDCEGNGVLEWRKALLGGIREHGPD